MYIHTEKRSYVSISKYNQRQISMFTFPFRRRSLSPCEHSSQVYVIANAVYVRRTYGRHTRKLRNVQHLANNFK